TSAESTVRTMAARAGARWPNTRRRRTTSAGWPSVPPLDIYRNPRVRSVDIDRTPDEVLAVNASRTQKDALRGSLDLLILKTLSLGPMHGWGISQRIQQISQGVLEVNQGSLYPALQRLEKDGLITSDWAT